MVVDLFLVPVNVGNQHWFLLAAHVCDGKVRVHVHDSKPVDPKTDTGRKRRREARGFAKILQKFLNSRAATLLRPLRPTLAAANTPHVCLVPKQTDFHSCGVYACSVALREAVGLELGV